ncbi:tyrosine-protein kinase domain-containing protein [Rhizobium sullae]|uniref:AAA domain-containing protein n=1 Tax=Rhizobium sullae TaxID=50338 RepID=A0A4R3PT44_RHISU|nr:tyrosine-protein kinase domain-containing protein [Rhizobium sullae]TCU06818.1 AAA domain-containing protein [Rhizobium sullae]
MLNKYYPRLTAATHDVRIGIEPAPLPFQLELSIARKRWKIILLCILIAGLAGSVFAVGSPDKYRALVQFAVDNRTMQLRQSDAIYSDSSVTDAIVESQVEILKSEPIALAVIQNLNLTRDTEFVPAGRPLRDQLAEFTGWSFLSSQVGLDITRTALHNFKQAFTAHRIGMSNIVEVRFESTDAIKSARIANTIAKVYLRWQSEGRAAAAKSASAWLRNHVQDAGPSTTVLTPAEPPSFTSGVSDVVVVGGFLTLGGCLGFAMAFFAEAADRRIRTKDDLLSALALNCYGILPRVPVQGEGRRLAKGDRLLDYALRQPMSSFAHVIQHARLAATSFHPDNTVRTIGVTSCHGGVGKSVVAANMAHAIAQAKGCDVLLVDANPYNSALTASMAPGATVGIIDVLAGRSKLDDALATFENVSVLPIAPIADAECHMGTIWTTAMSALIGEALARFEIIVFDLPAIEPFADVRASAQVLDVFLLVIGTGENSDRLRESLAAIDDLDRKIAGTILNDGVRI